MRNKCGNVFLSCIERKYRTEVSLSAFRTSILEFLLFFKKLQGLLSSCKRLSYEAYSVSMLFNYRLGASVNSIS